MNDDLHTREKFTPPPENKPPPQPEKVARSKPHRPPPHPGMDANAGASNTPTPKVFWHGEDDGEPLLEWLVEDMLYKVGVGLMAGQWGTFKTFIAIDLSVSVMTQMPFAGRATHRQGGVLFIAAEGQGQVRIRVEGAAIGKVANIGPSDDAVKIDPKRMPFSWVKFSPQLTDPQAAAELRTLFAHASKEMKTRFGLPLALVIIDTLMPAAQFKDANDSTEARRVMDMLATLGREFELLVLPVDHFGKDVSTGTRNSSGKEDAAETILALLGERSLEGVLSKPPQRSTILPEAHGLLGESASALRSITRLSAQSQAGGKSLFKKPLRASGLVIASKNCPRPKIPQTPPFCA